MIAARVSKETKAIIKKEKINVGRYLDDKIGEDYREKLDRLERKKKE